MNCTEVCSGLFLFLFNGIDLLCGILLVVYSTYLGVHGYAPEWLYVPILVLGAVLSVTAFLSWCGSSNQNCSCCLLFSSYLLVVLALGELVLGIVIFTQGAQIDRFLQTHQAQLKISDEQLEYLESHKFIPAYILVGLFAMEVLRFCCSSNLSRYRRDQRYEYRRLDSLRELDEDLLDVRKQKHISNKYAGLRDQFRQKYSTEMA